MRRKDREVTDIKRIIDILERADTARLAMTGRDNDHVRGCGCGCDNEYDCDCDCEYDSASGVKDFPYIVPLSFGFDVSSDVITVYFHGASRGESLRRKLLEADPRVCVEASIFNGYRATETGSGANGSQLYSVTAKYESFIGFGIAERVFGDEAAAGLDAIMRHCGYGAYPYDRSAAARMAAVYRVVMSEYSAKANI